MTIHPMRQIGVAIALALVASAGQADGRLSPADREAAKRQEAEIRSRLRMPSAQEMNQAAGGIRLPSTAASAPGVDVRALAEKYEQIKPGAQAVGEGAREPLEGLVVFVSLGMPKATLARLIVDAQRYRATLLLRGLKNKSIVDTAKAIHELQGELGERGPAWRIDPRLFERFRVEAVPAYVLLDAGSQVPGGCQARECIGDLRYGRIDGDITIDHALRSIAAGVPALRGQAEQLLARGQR